MRRGRARGRARAPAQMALGRLDLLARARVGAWRRPPLHPAITGTMGLSLAALVSAVASLLAAVTTATTSRDAPESEDVSENLGATIGTSLSATLQRELDAAIAAGKDFFQLPPGDIQFPPPRPGYYSARGPEALLIRNARHITISGSSEASGGATTLLFALGGGVRLHECTNVTFQSVTIDYAPLTPYVQAQIISITGMNTTNHSAMTCAAGQTRPQPPCPTGWWQSGNVCEQNCPSNAQTRNPITGRCLCGQAPPNSGCEGGVSCLRGQCCQAPPPPPAHYTIELAPRSLPVGWADVAHGVLWSGRTNRSKHEMVPSPGGAEPLEDGRYSWTTTAIPEAEVKHGPYGFATLLLCYCVANITDCTRLWLCGGAGG